jgi:hypothetical protein
MHIGKSTTQLCIYLEAGEPIPLDMVSFSLVIRSAEDCIRLHECFLEYDLWTNLWSWVNGYNVMDRQETLQFLITDQGFAVDESQSVDYIFGGQFPSVSANNGFIGRCRRNLGSILIFHFLANDLWKYDPVLNTWTCVFGDCNSNSTTALSSVTTDPATSGSLGYPRLAYLSNSRALILQASTSNALWFYDISVSKWYYVLAPTSTANYSAIGVISLKNRPPVKKETFHVINNQLFLFQVGSEEKWSLLICDITSSVWNSSTSCFTCTAGSYPDSTLFNA